MKTVIEMAKDAGINFQTNTGITGRVRVTTCGSQSVEALERFAELVRADEREAACDIVDYELDSNGHAEAIKIAIRARSNT
jgi:hypothetical protein